MAKPAAAEPTTVFTWAIANLERHTADGIVFIVHWTLSANDGTYSAGAYGSVGLEAPEGNVIPYADLTPEIVVGWTKSKPHCRHKLISSAHPPLLPECRGRKVQNRHRSTATPAG